MTLSTSAMSYQQYIEAVQSCPMSNAQKEVIDTVNARITAIFLDKPLGGNIQRWKELIVRVPEILATDNFLEDIHNYVRYLFADMNISDSHVCISDSGRVIEFHSNKRRPLKGIQMIHHLGEPDLASNCKKLRIV